MQNLPYVSSLSDEAFKLRVFSILTNRPCVSGGSKPAVRYARRRVRALGGRFYLRSWFATEERPGYCQWGIHFPGDPIPQGDVVQFGVSLGHCAHKLGDGCAKQGWRVWALLSR